MRTRAERRHHRERLQERRKQYWGGNASGSARNRGQVVDTPKPCSCEMCGNPRRHRGEVTVQERRGIT